jgi:hypothetical protein
MEYQISLKDMVIFELKSGIGRKFLKTKPKLLKEKYYLNFGSGNNNINGYVNDDFFYRFKFWKNI